MPDVTGLPMAPDWFANPPTYLFKQRPAANTNEAPLEDMAGKARRTLERLARELANLGKGGRNDALNRATFTMGGFSAAGVISRAEVESAFRFACTANGMVRDDGPRAFEATFASGFDEGMKRPFAVEESDQPPAPDGAKPRERFEITMFGDIEENPVKLWLVDDVLGSGEFSCFWGMPGCGKSVALGDGAFHVAAGREWFGRRVEPGLVIYIAAERAELTKRRFAALRKEHGVTDIPLAVVKGRLDFTSGLDDANAIIAAVKGLEKRTGKRCVWVIVDTVARTFGAGDENSAADMGAYVKACDLIGESLSAHLSIVHHCSRTGEKPRGSIALDGAVDATFKVVKNNGLHSIVLDKENDAPDAGAMRFRMVSVELGHDQHGKPTTAPVIVVDDTTVAVIEGHGGSKITVSKGKPRKGAATFSAALAAAGQESPDGRLGLHVDVLKDYLRKAFDGPTVKPTSLDTIVRRELANLISKGNAERIGEWLFPVAQEQGGRSWD